MLVGVMDRVVQGFHLCPPRALCITGAGGASHTSSSRKHEHYLKGLLHCGGCGRRLSLTLAKGRYLYFYCLGQGGSARTGCQQPYILAGDAEALVEDLYRRIQLPWVSRLTEELEAEIVERQAEASERRVVLTKTLAKLADERGKLLQAFYANAIPLDLLKAEQDRIGVAQQAANGELEATKGTSTAGRTFSEPPSASPATAMPPT
jgi:site-specific DNA recombinase